MDRLKIIQNIPSFTEWEKKQIWGEMTPNMKDIVNQLYCKQDPAICLALDAIFDKHNIINLHYDKEKKLMPAIYINDIITLKSDIRTAINSCTLDNRLSYDYYYGMMELLNMLWPNLELFKYDENLNKESVLNHQNYLDQIGNFSLEKFLIKSNIGQYFYNPMLGLLELYDIDESNNFIFVDSDNSTYVFNKFGIYEKAVSCNICSIFPTEALYLMHMRDPYIAWHIWRTGIQYTGRQLHGNIYYYINNNFKVEAAIEIYSEIDNTRYDAGNYFLTDDLAKENIPKIKNAFNELKNRIINER